MPTPAAAVKELTTNLRRVARKERAEKEKAYLKSEATFLGATVPDCRAEAARFAKEHKSVTTDELRAICEALFESGVHELKAVAGFLLERKQKQLNAADLRWLEPLLRASKTWALIDQLAVKVVGPITEREPSAAKTIQRWAKDDDFWIRRTALLSFEEPLRRGEGDFDAFERLAVPMLSEKEFFIRKAIGWILRDASKRRPELVKGFVARHGGQMSALTLREATRGLK